MAEKIYSLVSLDEFKTVMGVDDRDDRLSRFFLKLATKNKEQRTMSNEKWKIVI